MACEHRAGRSQDHPSFAPMHAKNDSRPGMPWILRILGPGIAFFTHAIQDLRVQGLSALPEKGPAILVANHTAFIDPLTIGVPLFQVGIAPRFAARADLFSAPVLGWMLKAARQIPIHRRGDLSHLSSDANAVHGLEDMDRALADGAFVVFFPEGTFTADPDGWAMRPKTGVARLALAHPEAPVIPVAHWGNERLVDPWTKHVNLRLFGRRTTRTEVRYASPVDLDRFRGRNPDSELFHEVADAIMDAVNDELENIRALDPGSAGIARRDHLWDCSPEADGNPAEALSVVYKAKLHERLAERFDRQERRIGLKALMARPRRQ